MIGQTWYEVLVKAEILSNVGELGSPHGSVRSESAAEPHACNAVLR